MAFRLIPALLVVVATCMAQHCPPQPQCGCAPQPTIIQMTCGGGAPPSHPPTPPPPAVHPPPPPPPPPTQESTNTAWTQHGTSTVMYQSTGWAQHETATPQHQTTDRVDYEASTASSLSALPSTDPEVCNHDNDLAIVIDSSGSVGKDNYKISLEFAARLAETWKQNPGNGVSAFIFADRTEKIFDLNEGQSMDAQAVGQAITNARYFRSSTNTADALDTAGDDLLQNGRPGIPKNIVLLTDGASNERNLTEAAAANIHASGIQVVSIGLGSNLSNDELLMIAGGRQDHVFVSSVFSEMLLLLKSVSEILCDQFQSNVTAVMGG